MRVRAALRDHVGGAAARARAAAAAVAARAAERAAAARSPPFAPFPPLAPSGNSTAWRTWHPRTELAQVPGIDPTTSQFVVTCGVPSCGFPRGTVFAGSQLQALDVARGLAETGVTTRALCPWECKRRALQARARPGARRQRARGRRLCGAQVPGRLGRARPGWRCSPLHGPTGSRTRSARACAPRAGTRAACTPCGSRRTRRAPRPDCTGECLVLLAARSQASVTLWRSFYQWADATLRLGHVTALAPSPMAVANHVPSDGAGDCAAGSTVCVWWYEFDAGDYECLPESARRSPTAVCHARRAARRHRGGQPPYPPPSPPPPLPPTRLAPPTPPPPPPYVCVLPDTYRLTLPTWRRLARQPVRRNAQPVGRARARHLAAVLPVGPRLGILLAAVDRAPRRLRAGDVPHGRTRRPRAASSGTTASTSPAWATRSTRRSALTGPPSLGCAPTPTRRAPVLPRARHVHRRRDQLPRREDGSVPRVVRRLPAHGHAHAVPAVPQRVPGRVASRRSCSRAAAGATASSTPSSTRPAAPRRRRRVRVVHLRRRPRPAVRLRRPPARQATVEAHADHLASDRPVPRRRAQLPDRGARKVGGGGVPVRDYVGAPPIPTELSGGPAQPAGTYKAVLGARRLGRLNAKCSPSATPQRCGRAHEACAGNRGRWVGAVEASVHRHVARGRRRGLCGRARRQRRAARRDHRQPALPQPGGRPATLHAVTPQTIGDGAQFAVVHIDQVDGAEGNDLLVVTSAGEKRLYAQVPEAWRAAATADVLFDYPVVFGTPDQQTRGFAVLRTGTAGGASRTRPSRASRWRATTCSSIWGGSRARAPRRRRGASRAASRARPGAALDPHPADRGRPLDHRVPAQQPCSAQRPERQQPARVHRGRRKGGHDDHRRRPGAVGPRLL